MIIVRQMPVLKGVDPMNWLHARLHPNIIDILAVVAPVE